MEDQIEEEKKAKLRQKIAFQVACEEKAFRIVERLIDNPVEQQWFLDALHFITPNHYHDIVEERSVSKLCGYPLCTKPLGKPISQKYFISTKTNKVYDIEDRKNFCSACCYKASKYIEKQISSVPLWSRKTEPRRVFDLLPLNNKTGKVGEEIQISTIDDMRSEMKKLERLDHYQQSLEQMGHRHMDMGNQRTKETRNQRTKEMNIGNQRTKETGNQRTEEMDTGNQGRGIVGKEDGNTEQAAKYSEECVYSLDKALSEMGIQDRNVSEEPTVPVNKTEKDSSNVAKNMKSVKERTHKELSDSCQSKSIADAKKCVKSNVTVSVGMETGQKIVSESKHEAVQTDEKEKDSVTVSKKEKKKSKSSKSSQQSKTDYLMKLLDKRKALLAQMADIQPLEGSSDSQKEESRNKTQYIDTAKSDTNGDNANEQSEARKTLETTENTGGIGLSNEKKESENDTTNIKDDTSVTDPERKKIKESMIKEITDNSQVNDTVKLKGNIIEEVDGRSEEKTAAKLKEKIIKEVSTDSGAKNSVKLTESVSQSSLPLKLTVLDVICKSLKSWITKETVEYLKMKEVPTERGVHVRGVNKTKFEKQYKELVAKVDAQERDFSQLIGEESLDEDTDQQARAPAPHFDVLRQEMVRDQLRVREFMKGTFTYREKKLDAPKADQDKVQIVLPTVDRYDQMIIRQRIILDRINKVLPDLMNPLHLPVGDVFTDIRQITETFHLTSENILFRPAEWSLVTLLLLKMLSKKLARLSAAFESPSVITYIQTLLTSVQADVQTLDRCVDYLCSV